MKTVLANDQRMSSPAFAPKIDITFDPETAENFDTRGQCQSMWDETWGQRVEVAEGMLYITLYGRAENHTTEQRNVLRDR